MEKVNKIDFFQKRDAWVHALRRKLEMRTLEEWDYETLSETIFKDDVLEFYRECQATYGVVSVQDEGIGMEADLDFFLSDECNLGEILHIDSLNGKTLLDYVGEHGFPMTFRTWPDNTPDEFSEERR